MCVLSFHVSICLLVCVCVCVCVRVLVPRSRVEVKVTAMLMPPDKANAGGLVEGQQTSDDDVSLVCVCREE